MDTKVVLKSEKREESGKGFARRLRAKGMVPGVLYGVDTEPQSFAVEEKDIADILRVHGLNPIIKFSIGSEDYTCMIADYQKDVFQRNVTHLDLKTVKMDKKVQAKVSVFVDGTEKIRSRGCLTQIYRNELRVKTYPQDIPKSIHVDVTKMKPGSRLIVKDMEIPEKVEVLDDPMTTVLSVVIPRALLKKNVGGEAEAGVEGEEG